MRDYGGGSLTFRGRVTPCRWAGPSARTMNLTVCREGGIPNCNHVNVHAVSAPLRLHPNPLSSAYLDSKTCLSDTCQTGQLDRPADSNESLGDSRLTPPSQHSRLSYLSSSPRLHLPDSILFF